MYPLPFDKRIFRSGQQLGNNYCRIIASIGYFNLGASWPRHENHCTGHKPYNNIRVVKCKVYMLELLLLMNGKLTIGKVKSSRL
jgi:hypothetical protein